MCRSACCIPVRPLLCPFTVAEDQDAVAKLEVEDEVVDVKRAAVLGEPVVGVEIVTLDERGPGALPLQSSSVAEAANPGPN